MGWSRKRRARDRLHRATQHAIWESDPEAGVRSWGESFYAGFGYKAQDVKGTAAWWLAHIELEDREKVRHSMEAAVAGREEHWTSEYRFQRAEASGCARSTALNSGSLYGEVQACPLGQSYSSAKFSVKCSSRAMSSAAPTCFQNSSER